MQGNKLKSRKGITLVALVLTIIVLIILATVAISYVIGDNGLITKAQQAAEQAEIESVREKLAMAEGTALADGRGYIDPEHYFDIIYEEGIIGDRENDVIDNGDGTYEITTTEGYIFIITLLPTPDEVRDIEIEYSGTSEGPRIVKIEITEKTTNSATVKVDARNANNANYKYEYKKSSEGEDSWKEVETSKSNTCTIENLTQGETYDIRVTVETNKGSVTRERGVHLGELPEGTITYTPVEWLGDGTAKTTINTSAEGYQLQYQINAVESNGWKNIENGGTIDNLTYPSTVYARIFDGTNESEHASVSLEDKIAPSVTVTGTGTTSNSVSVSVAASDGQSGMVANPTYTYSIKVTGTDESTYTTPSNASNLTSNTYTFTGLTQGTNYTVRVEVNGDKAGNETTETRNVTTIPLPTIEETLKEGDYINYIDGKGTTRKCVVLYDNSSEYGIEIITMESVEDVTFIGQKNSSDYDTGISQLNEKADEYINNDYANNTRCVGSVPDNKNSQVGETDNNYLTDLNKMLSLNINSIGKEYWLASRVVSGEYNCIRYVTNTGDLSEAEIAFTGSGFIPWDEVTAGLRPVFKLKTGIKVTGGDGTETNPYTLGTSASS